MTVYEQHATDQLTFGFLTAELLLEHGVEMLQGLPPNSGLGAKVSDGFISMLWNDLPHPSSTHAGPTTRYRRHDGGGNNPHNTEMGKAGSPYARNVPPMKPKGIQRQPAYHTLT